MGIPSDFTEEKSTRRHFMGSAAMWCTAFILPPGSGIEAAENYYQSHRKAFSSDFDQICEGAQSYLGASCGESRARTIVREAKRQFADLLPALPDIGGDENMDVVFLVKAAQYCAFYRAMKPEGYDAYRTGKMMYDLCASYYAFLSDVQKIAEKERLFSPSYLHDLDGWCQWTQQRLYPANWVASFVRGDGCSFDYGYDMTECAICKYFKSMNIYELQPYFCTTDFPRSHALGTGLSRKRALGFGDECCDFRYRRDRKVTQNWDTETKKSP